MTVDDWHGLYRKGWGDNIVPEAFSHPAKYSFGLIEHIYQHMADEGWIEPGSVIVDPFGGIAGGAFHAMKHGCAWIGVELEARFVTLGNQNIDLWNNRYAPHFPGWGTARLVQGDSRKLLEVVSAAGGVVSSPPYADGCAHTGGDDPKPEYVEGGEIRLPGIRGVVSSPPYAETLLSGGGGGGSGESTALAPGGFGVGNCGVGRGDLAGWEDFGMREDEEANFITGWELAQEKAHWIAVQKGFWDSERNLGEIIALMHSELSEALEAARKENPPSEHIPNFSGLEEELADLVIRLMDLAGGIGLRVGEAVIAKMRFNEGRVHKHGKAF